MIELGANIDVFVFYLVGRNNAYLMKIDVVVTSGVPNRDVTYDISVSYLPV